MLHPEEAKKRIEDARVKDAEQRRVAAVALLPDEPITELADKPTVPADMTLRQIAYAIMGHERDGRRFSSAGQYYFQTAEQRETYEAGLRALPLLNAKDRRRIFEAFLPKLAPHLEQLWQFIPDQPYQRGYVRKAFRAPGHQELYAVAQSSMFVALSRQMSWYDEDILWFAQYAPYMGYVSDSLGKLFAAVIDSGDETGEELFQILLASARGEHEIGAMGHHVTRALLSASRPDGWAFIEKMLLAAQREEGLRQTILESIDEAHPEAFRRMLRVIIDNELVRFSAVTRALDVWLGYSWDSESVRVINQTLTQLLTLLENADARAEALRTGGGETVYMALWAIAFEDAFAAIDAAEPLLDDPGVERRFGAVNLLVNLGLSETHPLLLRAMADPDLRIAIHATSGLHGFDGYYTYRSHIAPELSRSDLFEIAEKLLARMPAQRKVFEPIIWPWMTVLADRHTIADLMAAALGERSPKRLIPHMNDITSYYRVEMAKKLAALGLQDADVRDVLFRLIGDRESYVRNEMLKLFASETLQTQEAQYLEGLMSRKANDLRRGVLSLLAKQDDTNVLTSADRLTESRKVEQRLAGLELLQIVHKQGRAVAECRARAERYTESRAELDGAEQNYIAAILEAEESTLTLNDALGLMNPAGRSKPTAPQMRDVKLTSEAAVKTLVALDELIHEHRATPIYVKTWQGEDQEILLGNANYGFPLTSHLTAPEEDAGRLPLREVWEQWVESRSGDMLDDDGLELLRAQYEAYIYHNYSWQHPLDDTGDQPELVLKLRYPALCTHILNWLVRLYPAPNSSDYLLDCMETTWSQIPPEKLAGYKDHWGHHQDWRSSYNQHEMVFRTLVSSHRKATGSDWRDDHMVRYWGLLRWMDEPIPGVSRHRPDWEEIVSAHTLGVATDDDMYDQLIGPRDSHFNEFSHMNWLSSRKHQKYLDEHPAIAAIFERCRQRVLEVEVRRGEMPTAATPAAQALSGVPGADWFVKALQALGRQPLSRDTYGDSRAIVFSHLLHVAYPTEADTPQRFAKLVKAARIAETPLIEVGVYAPHWATHIEHVLGWKGFVDAVWWLHAHTKERRYFHNDEIRSSWAAETNDRTPLSANDLIEGAVDVEWFWRVYKTLGAERWKKVYNAAKYSSSGIGHGRAKLFADAMLGKLELPALKKRILEKRYQDAVRALGLLPLPKSKKASVRDNAILERYQIMQELLRLGRKVGPQRRESEKLAVQIGMENLARTAGYPDPQRLQWAMEAREAEDLRAGAIIAEIDDVKMTLSLDVVGKPQLAIVKVSTGKPLKSLPAKLKKAPQFVALRDRKAQIDKQHSRMRASLENAMCRMDSFTAQEIGQLLDHPVLAPMLEQLIFIGDGVMGFPAQEGRALVRYDGDMLPLDADASIRIAHPVDLLQSGDWPQWQRDCFLAERIQPFKQVFRELYVLTDAERADGAISRRYAGHQVHQRQAVALLGSRGWISHPDYGVQKTFHRQNISVHLHFLGGYFTPAEVEGLTIEGVLFTEAGKWQPLQLDAIPPIMFSEVMRDLDLVVSVAHRGGVDPESTASTTEMRSALIRETCALLKIDNIELQKTHALIEGKLGSYSVHLGSAIVHRQPGGALCIIPVHAQHRGRIFLPFADDDPKTAEVISKVVLLARDEQIKDPTILQQIFAKG